MERHEKEEIRARTDIVALISGYTTLRKAGKNYKGLCPFHQEKTPSFVVDADRGSWRCFGSCSTGGDVFSFLMKAEGLSFGEAGQQLAEQAGVTLARFEGDGEVAARAQQVRDERARLHAINELALRFFRDSFGRARLARDYAARRGLAHETLEAFGIGFAPDDWSALSDFLEREGCVMADAEKAGLIFPSKVGAGFTDKFRGRLIFPIHDVQDRVVAFGGRLLVDAEKAPKYLNSPETPVFSKSRILYGLNRARRAIQEQDLAVVVEGYTDVVAAHQAGFPCVVATLGTSLTDEHIRLLGRYTKNVVLSFDSDEAGVRAALRAAALFESAGDWTLRVLALPAGEDPDSLLARGDAPAFRKAIESALSVPEFRLRALRAQHDTATEAGKLAFLREALPILAEIRSPLDRDLLLRRLAPYHPAFAAGDARAEESLRAELARHLPHASSSLDPYPAPPVHLRGETVLPPGGRRGGPVAFRPEETFRRSGGRGRWMPATVSPPEPLPSAPTRTAADVAERILLRALLTDEFAPLVRGRLQPADFPDAEATRLVDALLPLIGGGIAPSDAIAELTDADLADYANAVVLEDEAAPLSPGVIGDCLRTLERRRQAAEIREIRAEAEAGAEGKRAGDDELLRRWEQTTRAMKAPDAANGDPGGDGMM